MTRKHFIRLAADIALIKDISERREAAERWSDFCNKENPRFNRAKFYAACNVKEDV